MPSDQEDRPLQGDGRASSLLNRNKLIGHSGRLSGALIPDAGTGDSPFDPLSPVIWTITWIRHFSATAEGRILRTAAANAFSSEGTGASDGCEGGNGSSGNSRLGDRGRSPGRGGE